MSLGVLPPLRGNEGDEAVLRRYGVNLGARHLSGYRYAPAIVQSAAVAKPWEADLLAQIGSSKAVLCEKLEGWDNEEFLFEVRDGIAYCTMNRPLANNAMNHGISAGLHDSARILRNRPDIRIAVLTGKGRMFCAGGDPKAFQAAQAGAGVLAGEEGEGPAQNPPGGFITSAAALVGAAGNTASAGQFAHDMMDWASLPQFTIACMNGSAMGGGVGLLCNCDMVIAIRTAHASLSEVKLGVIPAVISPHVIRAIGTANARKLFCTAENCNMQMALEIGLVQQVVNDASEFPNAIHEIAQKIQQQGPGAVAASKRAILNCLNMPVGQSLLDYTVEEYARVRGQEECREGMLALGARTRPRWVDTRISTKDTWHA